MSVGSKSWKGQERSWLVLLLTLLLTSSHAMAQVSNQLPAQLQGGEIVDMPNSQLPLDAQFTDHDGNRVRLGDYFKDGKPVLITLIYFRCPMLCSLVVNGMVDSLREVKYSPGKDFTMLTVSFDPLEGPALANMKRKNYIQMYDRAGTQSGWHFLTGTEKNIRALTDSLGFSYRWSSEQQAYLHAAGLFVATPDGHLSRTLYGVQFDPLTMKGSLLEAGRGGIGTALDKVYFSCMHFDAASGQYSLAVMNFTRFVALLIVFTTALTLIGFFRHERMQERRRQLALAAETAVSAGVSAADSKGEPGDGEVSKA